MTGGSTIQVCVMAGSPRRGGASAALAGAVARGIEAAGCHAEQIFLADMHVAGCTGCGACNTTGVCVLPPDGFSELCAVLDASAALALVAPVYFAGPPSQLKACFDRMQPRWAQRMLLGTREATPPDARKPFDLAVTGGGGDPFGFEPLVTCAHSALRMMDFELANVYDCVGWQPDSEGDQSASDAFEQQALAWGIDLAYRAQRSATDPEEG